MFSDCRCCLITAFVGDNKLILILSYNVGWINQFTYTCYISTVYRQPMHGRSKAATLLFYPGLHSDTMTYEDISTYKINHLFLFSISDLLCNTSMLLIRFQILCHNFRHFMTSTCALCYLHGRSFRADGKWSSGHIDMPPDAVIIVRGDGQRGRGRACMWKVQLHCFRLRLVASFVQVLRDKPDSHCS